MRYLLITFYKKRSGKVDEQATVARNLNKTALTTANIIFDWKERKILRCFVDGNVMDKDWNRLETYYRPIYQNVFEELDKMYGYTAPEAVVVESTNEGN